LPPEAIRDDIQRAEVWNLQTGQTIPDLACDAAESVRPEGGWLWARRSAISPGYRSSAILESHFSADETEFSMLCWDGVTQRWNARGWGRLESIPQPPFWRELMSLESARSLADNDVASRSADGRIAVLRVRRKSFGFGTTYVWDRSTSHVEQVPGECAARLQPVYALSSDAGRIVLVCNKGTGYVIRSWDLRLGHELALKGTDFGIVRGAPTLRGEGVALSPDGRYLAAALLDLSEALLVTPIPAPLAISRSDLRVWSVDDGREVASVPIDDLAGSAAYFHGVDLAFSPDSTTLVTAGKRMRIYNVDDLMAVPKP